MTKLEVLLMKKIDLSPNFSKRNRSKNDIKFVIIHYTGMQSKIESIKRLKDQNARVSCHYLIDRSGFVTQMVKDNFIAWHAGKSKWKNLNDLNRFSIGIELVNKGHNFGYENFPNKQIQSLIKLCKSLKRKYRINKQNFLGHSDIAPLRKIDPGENFPWKKLSKFKLGIWYKLKKIKLPNNKNDIYKTFFFNISKIGYRYFKKNKRARKDQLIIKAFQRRYLPDKITGRIDQKLLKISYFLIKN